MSVSAGQNWRADGYSENAIFVPELGRLVVELLAPVAGERILDLGCGDGVLTELLWGGSADVIGVDGSAEMVAAAVARELNAEQMDGHHLTFDTKFDACFRTLPSIG